MEKGSLSVILWMIVAPLKAKAQTNDPPPSGSCYASPFSSDPESNLDSVVQYSRRGNHIWQVTPTSTSAEDWGYCVFCGFFEPHGVRIINWTDFDAGGEFGYSPDGVHFYPFDLSQDNPELAGRVNAYRTNPNFWGILKIAPRLDDIPSFCSFCGMPTYNDDPVTGDPWKMTVWEFEIDPPFIDALPQDGATYTFTATIRPEKDHYGQSMARVIEFGLGSSAEPGYCLNATRVQGLWTDTTAEDNDLKFVPNQPGLEVYAEGVNPTNYSIAVTNQAVLSASIQVRCLDYGAYGTVWAYAYGLGLARWKGTFVERGAMIPLDQRDGLDNDGDGKVDEDLLDGEDKDEDGRVDEEARGNCIYDGWQWNNGAATDDDDPEPPNQLPPANQPRPGDLLSRYEEYRGFVIQGSHQRTNPNMKDVFIYNPHRLDVSGFATLGLQIHLVRKGEFAAVFDVPTDNDGDRRIDEDPLDGVDNDRDGQFDEDPADEDYPILIELRSSMAINRYWRTANIATHPVIAVLYNPFFFPEPGNPPPGQLPLGTHGPTFPGVPPYVFIYVRQLRYYTDPNRGDSPIDPRDPAVIRLVVAHELGNTLSIQDHTGATTRQCFMYDTDNSYLNANYDPIPGEYCGANPGCRWLFSLKGPSY